MKKRWLCPWSYQLRNIIPVSRASCVLCRDSG